MVRLLGDAGRRAGDPLAEEDEEPVDVEPVLRDAVLRRDAHDLLDGYVPGAMGFAEARSLRRDDPDTYVKRAVGEFRVAGLA